MNVGIRPAVPSDMDAIVANARRADVEEMEACGTTVRDAIENGLRRSDWTLTGLLEDEPVCMFGVAPVSILGGKGAPWMLAAEGLERAQVPFLRACRPVIAEMRLTYPFLLNVVSADNTLAIRWLQWLGFKFDHAPIEVRGHTFLLFSMDNANV
jgi:hypothetical protein